MPPQGGAVLSRFGFWCAAVLALTADLLSKKYVFAYLDTIMPVQQRVVIPGVLVFSKNINEGGAWGVASGYSALFLVVTALIIPFVVIMAYSCRDRGAPLWALGLLAGGAAGNLYDRIFVSEYLYHRGEYVRGVRDFIDVGWWPVFNVADIVIVVGVAVYMLWSFRRPEPPAQGQVSAAKESDAHA